MATFKSCLETALGQLGNISLSREGKIELLLRAHQTFPAQKPAESTTSLSSAPARTVSNEAQVVEWFKLWVPFFASKSYENVAVIGDAVAQIQHLQNLANQIEAEENYLVRLTTVSPLIDSELRALESRKALLIQETEYLQSDADLPQLIVNVLDRAHNLDVAALQNHIQVVRAHAAEGITKEVEVALQKLSIVAHNPDSLNQQVASLEADATVAATIQAKGLSSVEFFETFAPNTSHQAVVGAMKSLQSLDYVVLTPVETESRILTKEGAEYALHGTPEFRLFAAIHPESGEAKDVVEKALGQEYKVGFSKAMSSKWIKLDNATGRITRVANDVTDTVREQLLLIQRGQGDSLTEAQYNELKKRTLATKSVLKSLLAKKGPKFSTTIVRLETDLTPEMIATGSWESKTFKPFNFDALGVPPTFGTLHPLMKVRAEVRSIFLEMGFAEMATNNFVESAFWNFDALFQPQQHPARDAHDTFFISEPRTSQNLPQEYLQRVKATHEHGGDTGSTGYVYDWKVEEAERNILRTHTTAVSARMLYKVAQEKPFKPVKLFSVDKVFRNEALDATHLAEFYQVEGLIADYGLTLGDLIGLLDQFFSRIGLRDLKFKSAYNPYTEPSMEVFGYHEGLGKYVEVGNSGVFRPEMLIPLGLPPGVTVIAFGLGLERPTMIVNKFPNIRALVGHAFDLKLGQQQGLVRF